MHAIRPYCNYSVISIANSSDFLVKLRKIKPMRGLCNSYQVYRIFFYVRFLCRKNVIDNVVSVETIFYLTLAYVTCYNFLKILANTDGSLSVTCSAVPCQILVAGYLT